MQNHLVKTLGGAISCFLLFFSSNLSAQNGPKWSTQGNSAATGDFIGTTNNLPFILKVNNAQALLVNTNGSVLFNQYGGTGNGLLFADNTGLLNRLNFSGHSSDVLLGNGTWGNISSTTGWIVSGTNIYSLPSYKVGIGTSTPTDMLTVNGNITASGTITATGLNIIQASGVKADSLQGIKSVSASSDLYINSLGGTFHTILNAGSSGNVGIGTPSPAYKLDVLGQIHSSGDLITGGNLLVAGNTQVNKIRVSRIAALPGDSIIRFGDSTTNYNTSTNNISWTLTTQPVKGFSIGNASWRANNFNNSSYPHGYGQGSIAIGSGPTYANGKAAIAIGSFVETNADEAMVIGAGLSNAGSLVNSTSYSLMIGYNSNIPTLFIGPSNGAGTTGQIGINTTSPSAKIDMDVTDELYTGLLVKDHNRNNAMPDLIVSQGGNLNQKAFVARLNGSGPVVDNFVVFMDGHVFAREIKVTLDNPFVHPDYVFADNYKLMPLKELQKSVMTNKHLPGVPSASDVALANGINLGEMSTKQLEKIEESYLYIFQLKEELDNLKALLKAQQEEIKKLKGQ